MMSVLFTAPRPMQAGISERFSAVAPFFSILLPLQCAHLHSPIPSKGCRPLYDPLQTGKTVLIRHPAMADRDEFLKLRQSSKRFHQRWEVTPPKGFDPYGSEAFTRFQMTANLDRMQRYLVCRTEDEAIVGAIELSEIVRGAFQSAYMGYWVGSAFARRGYMSEGIDLALRYVFREMKLHRVEANIQPTNKASIALVEKVGFTREGYSRRYLKIAGRWRDHERWAILKDDWSEKRKRK